MPTKKLYVAGMGLAIAVIGGVSFLVVKGTDEPVDFKTGLEAKIGLESDFRSKEVEKDGVITLDAVEGEQSETVTREEVVDAALALFLRRENGDEPSQAEWHEVEDMVDAMRIAGDSPILSAVDQALEKSDATDRSYYLEELRQLLEL